MSEIREISIKNFVDFFNNYDPGNNIMGNNPVWARNINHSNKLSKSLLDFFFDSWSVNQITIKQQLFESVKRYINKKCIEKIQTDVSRLSFNMMYPNIILNLYHNGEIEVSVTEYMVLFEFMVNNRKAIYLAGLTGQGYMLLKILINGFYGQCRKINSIIFVSDIGKIVNYYKNVIEKLAYSGSNLIYANVDELFYDDTSQNEVEETIKILNLPYEIEDGMNAYFIGRQRYILDHYGDIQFHGHFQKAVLLEREIVTIVQQLKWASRKNKVNKLMEKI